MEKYNIEDIQKAIENLIESHGKILGNTEEDVIRVIYQYVGSKYKIIQEKKKKK